MCSWAFAQDNKATFVFYLDPQNGAKQAEVTLYQNQIVLPPYQLSYKDYVFYGWESEGVFYPVNSVVTVKPGQVFYGVWEKYSAILLKIEEVDGDKDSSFQNGETFRFYFDLKANVIENFEGFTLRLFAPKELSGKINVSGASLGFPTSDGILVQATNDFYTSKEITLIAEVKDSSNNVFYSDINFFMNKPEIELEATALKKNGNQLTVQVTNNSAQASIVSPTFSLNGVQQVSNTLKASSSTILTFDVESKDETLVLDVKDKFSNSYSCSFENIVTKVQISLDNLNWLDIEKVTDLKEAQKQVQETWDLQKMFNLDIGKNTFVLRKLENLEVVESLSFDYEVTKKELQLKIENFEIHDLSYNDGVFNPGEVFGFSFDVVNDSSSEISNFAISINYDNEDFSFNRKTYAISQLQAGERRRITDDIFRAKINSEISDSERLYFSIDINKNKYESLRLEKFVDVEVFNPDFEIRKVSFTNKQSYELIYPSEKLNVRISIENFSNQYLRDFKCDVSCLGYEEDSVTLSFGNIGKTKATSSKINYLLKVPSDVKAGDFVTFCFRFYDAYGRTFVRYEQLEVGISSFNFVFDDFYLIVNNQKHELTAYPGQTVEIGFITKNIGLDTSVMINSSIEVLEGPAQVVNTNSLNLGSVISNVEVDVLDVDSRKKTPLSLKINDTALIGDKVKVKVNLYSLLSLIKTEEFEINIIK